MYPCEICGNKRATQTYANLQVCNSCLVTYKEEHEPIICPNCGRTATRNRIDENGRCDFCRQVECVTCHRLVDPPDNQCSTCKTRIRVGMCTTCSRVEVDYFNTYGQCEKCDRKH